MTCLYNLAEEKNKYLYQYVDLLVFREIVIVQVSSTINHTFVHRILRQNKHFPVTRRFEEVTLSEFLEVFVTIGEKDGEAVSTLRVSLFS